MPSEHTKIDLERITDYLGFESFSHDLMSREGYKDIQPLGGFKDKGRDAVHVAKSNGDTTIFVYSVRDDWFKKLEEDLTKIQTHQHICDSVVFVTTSALTAGTQDDLKTTVKTKYGWKLEIFDLERIATLVDNHHEDLKSRHRGIFPISDVKTRPELPEGLEDLPSVLTNHTVVLPDGDLTFPTALTTGRIFERSETANAVADLVQLNHALIVGNSGTGKTIMAFQAAEKLKSCAEDKQLKELESYYCTVSDCRPGEFLNFLDDRSPSLLLIDNAEEDEQTAYALLSEWQTRRKGNSCQRVYLLFISESHYSDDGSPRPVNLFHEHPRTIRALPSDDEFQAFVSKVWPKARQSEYSQPALRTISRYTGKSLALGVLAITATLKMINDGHEEDSAFRKNLLSEIKVRRKLADMDTEATKACVFSYYGIPIRIKAFGEEAARKLFERHFLVYSATSKAEMHVFSRSIGELWFEDRRYYRDDIVSDLFDAYLQHPESNYDHVLAGLHKSGELSLLGDVVNNNFQVLHDRIDFETDLRKTCTAVECVSAYRRRLAIQLLAQSLYGKAGPEPRPGRPLHLRLSNSLDQEPHIIARYVNVITHHLRRIFVGSAQAESVRPSLDVLKKIVGRETTSLSVVARICEAVARSNRDAARSLVELVVSNGKRQISTEDRLIFAGTISWFDRDHARQIFQTLNSAAITTLIVETDSPKTALQLLSSVESLDHRVANTVAWNVIRDRRFQEFAQRLIQPPTSLYEIARLIVKVRDISFRAAIKLTDRLLPVLQQAIMNDKRLTALGFMLGVLRRTNGRVAGDMLLSIKDAVKLDDLLDREAEPVRFAKTLLSIYGVDKNLVGNYLESVDDFHWIRLFGRCRNLTQVALLLRAVTLTTYTRNTTIEKVLNIGQVRSSIQQLSLRKLATRDLANYATIVALACPLSPKNKTLLLSFIAKTNFEEAIHDEEDPRRAGEALRAYVAAFPLYAYKFANDLVKNDVLKTWSSSEDIAAVAYLLHSAAEIDGRLSDALGQRVDARNALAQLQLEPRGTRIAEYLHAVSLVAPLEAQRICKGLYGNEKEEDKNPLLIIQEAGDLRRIIKILAAIRTSHSSFYIKWLRQYCKDPQKKSKLKLELASRSYEESNLNVLSILFGQVAAFDKELACDLIYGLELPWVAETGLRDNRITEILQFIAGVAQQVNRDTRDNTRNNRQQVLARLQALFDECLPRIGEIRSVRSLCLSLVELFRVADAFNSPDFLERGWNAVSVETLCDSIKISDDFVGCGLLSFLLTKLEAPSAKVVMTEAETLVHSVGMDHPVVPSLFALALVGARREELVSRNIVNRLRDLGGTRTWEIGFANWVIAQRALAEEKEPVYPTIGMEVLHANNDLQTFSEEFDRAGSNLRYAFVLALFNQLSLHDFDDAETLVDSLRREIGGRSGLESRNWVKELLNEFGRQVGYTGAKVEARKVTFVAQCVRDLSPRTEAVPGVDTGDEPGQSGESETWEL